MFDAESTREEYLLTPKIYKMVIFTPDTPGTYYYFNPKLQEKVVKIRIIPQRNFWQTRIDKDKYWGCVASGLYPFLQVNY